MLFRLHSYICALLVLISCASPPWRPLEIVDIPPHLELKQLDLPTIDDSKDAVENSFFYAENIKHSTNSSGFYRHFIDLINIENTMVKNDNAVDFEGKTYDLKYGYGNDGVRRLSLWDRGNIRFVPFSQTNGKKAYYHYFESPMVVFKIKQHVGSNINGFVVESVDRLRSKTWSLDEVPLTPRKYANGVSITYKVDINGRMTNIDFPGATERYSQITTENMDKWRTLLKSSKYRLIQGPYASKQPYEDTYSTKITIEYLNNADNATRYAVQMSGHRDYLLEKETYNNAQISAIAGIQARKIAAEEEVRKRKENDMQVAAARAAAYKRQVAAQKAYEASPAGIKAKAVAVAKRRKREAEKRNARLAKGWPSDAIGILSKGSWVCNTSKSGYRAYMIDKVGNNYASLGSDCDYVPRNLYVSGIRPTSTGIMRISLIAGGVFYTSPQNIEQ